MDEFAIIRRLTEGRQTPAFQKERGIVTGIGDDAAVANLTSGCQLVMTCDTMTEEIHFKKITMRDTDIGYKAMAAAVSDIAAMGAIPRYALISLSFPKGTALDKIESIYKGLYECADRFRVVIAGGDTTSAVQGITVAVTIIGEVERGKALLRSVAKPGDVLFATGFLGLSAAGLQYLLDRGIPSGEWDEHSVTEAHSALVRAHCRPDPQIEAGQLLQRSGICHALNDVSDGLASEAWEIAEASGVGIDLIEERIPVAGELLVYAQQRELDALDFILYGGEDYQLVGTMREEHAAAMQAKFREAGLALHIIGYVQTQPRGVRLVQSGGKVVSLEKKGYNHF
ncbi:thiamine-phosphate kinase [Paenibacillus doosanensis]|uniref:thiamine-phosphate kinase n=1 Tax=Paenibacillus doosanensis TaxID=1229154 RepID=UPI00217F93DC|nr:thiamine-phosphate kinase [Paenibacillus doosanensis]MCS7463243.1 thiamine-phosphate kinase [Paenibacillus doosanensis]